jgi:selenocysteine lyase/cysteine desulfurase
MLGRAVARTLRPGDTLIVSSAGHEANIGPWLRAAAAACHHGGARVAWWHPSGPNAENSCPLDTLQTLIAAAAAARSPVRLIAFPHASNLLGGVADVAAIASAARAAGALSVCDGVAFAPHDALDVPAWGIDFYALSLYKTYGPHAGALYGRAGAWRDLRAAGGAPNHAFITAAAAAAAAAGDDDADADANEGAEGAPWYVWELGGVCHEGAAALAGLRPYLRALANGHDANGHDDAKSQEDAEEWRCVRAAFARMPSLEAPVQARLSAFFAAAHAVRRLRLLGPRGADDDDANGHHLLRRRVPTFSFVPTGASGVTPAGLVAACFAARVAVRHGHMYAPRLLRRLNVPIECADLGDDFPAAADDAAPRSSGGGVVRVSAVHYNTEEEAQRCIDAIDAALG